MNPIQFACSIAVSLVALLSCSLADDAVPVVWRLVAEESFPAVGSINYHEWEACWRRQNTSSDHKRLFSRGEDMFATFDHFFPLPALRVEFDARVSEPKADAVSDPKKPKAGAVSDLGCLIGRGKTQYLFLLGAADNRYSCIASLSLNGAKKLLAVNPDARIEIGKWHHLVAEINGRKASMSVDGKPILEAALPEDPPAELAFSLYSRRGPAAFDNVRVHGKEATDPMPAVKQEPPQAPQELPRLLVAPPQLPEVKPPEQTLAHLRDIPALPPPEDKPAAVDLQRVALRLDSPRLKSGTWPVRFGMPLPDETLWKADNLRVVDRNGREIPSQRAARATWTKGGAIRWMSVEFMADCANMPDGYAVEYGRAVQAAVLKPVAVQETADAITVDTGTLKAVISKKKGSLIDAAWFDTDRNGNYDRNEQVIAPGSGQAAYFVTTTGERYATDQTDNEYSAIVETTGPVRTVIRTRGWYKNSQGERACYFTHRYYFYAGKSDVKLTASWVITRDTEDLKFKDVGLRLPLSVDNARAALGGEKGAWIVPKHLAQPAFAVQGGRHQAWLRADERRVEAKDLDGWADLSSGEPGPNLTVFDRIRKRLRLAASGEHGLSVTVFDMAEQSPVSLEVSGKTITFHAFSSEPGNILDFTVTHLRKLWGEEAWARFEAGRQSIYPPLTERLSNGCGQTKTHELLLRFHGLEPVETTAAAARVFQEPPLVSVDPVFACGTGAFGPFHPYDTTRFPDQEINISKAFDEFLNVLDRLDPRYDFWDYGMGMPHYHNNARTGKVTYTGYRREYDAGYGNPIMPWLLYLRSGDRRYRHFGVQNGYHMMDWHTRHWNNDALGKRIGWITADHGTWPFDQTASGWTFNHWMEYLLLNYYVTGNERAMDVALEIMDGHYNDYIRLKNDVYHGGGQGNWLANFSAMYRATWEDRYKEGFKLYEGEQLKACCAECGGFAPYANWKHENHAGVDRSTWREIGQYAAAVTPGADSKTRPALVQYARWDLEYHALLGSPDNAGLGFAHLVGWQDTKDPAFIAVARLHAANLGKECGFLGYDGLSHIWRKLVWLKLVAENPDVRSEPFPLRLVAERSETLPMFVRHKGGRDTTLRVTLPPRVTAPDGKDMTAEGVQPADKFGFCRVLIPAAAAPGVYQVAVPPAPADKASPWTPYASQTILCNADLPLMFGAQHGVPLQNVWFHAPEGTKSFRVRAKPGVTLLFTTPGGATIEAKGPVAVVEATNGAAGIWKMQQKDGVPFMMLCDIPAYVALRLEMAHAVDTGLRAQPPAEIHALGRSARAEKAGETQEEWSAGAFPKLGENNKALHVSGQRSWRIPLGEQTEPGRRQHLDMRQGTLEMRVWLNGSPDLTTAMGIPLTVQLDKSVELSEGMWTRDFIGMEYKNSILINDGRMIHNAANFGPWQYGVGMTLLMPHRWYHLAVVWKLNDGTGKFFFQSYLDGVPNPGRIESVRLYGWPEALSARPIDDHIAIGGRYSHGHDLLIDELRISDAPRYGFKERFAPPEKPYTPDEHTLLLLHLDGGLEPAPK